MFAALELQVVTDLPAGFSALWMDTTAVRITCGMEPFDAQPDAADQLCRLLSCAPASYRRVCSERTVRQQPRPSAPSVNRRPDG